VAMSEHALAVFAGLGGMLGWGFADFFAKWAIGRIGDLRTLFWSQAVGVAPLLGILAARHQLPTLYRFDLVFLVIFGVVQAMWYLGIYAGFAKGQVSVLSPVFSSYAVLVALLSALFFGEHISVATWLAIGLVFAGVVLIGVTPRDVRHVGALTTVPGLPEVVAALVAFSLWLVLLERFIGGRDWVFFAFVIRAVETITLAAYAHVTRRPLALRPHRSLRSCIAVIGGCDVIAFGAFAYGLSGSTQTSVVAALSSAYSLLTVVLARLFLSERLSAVQGVATGVILVGIVLVALN
jgi:uncharacterized membrane protein